MCSGEPLSRYPTTGLTAGSASVARHASADTMVRNAMNLRRLNRSLFTRSPRRRGRPCTKQHVQFGGSEFGRRLVIAFLAISEPTLDNQISAFCPAKMPKRVQKRSGTTRHLATREPTKMNCTLRFLRPDWPCDHRPAIEMKKRRLFNGLIGCRKLRWPKNFTILYGPPLCVLLLDPDSALAGSPDASDQSSGTRTQTTVLAGRARRSYHRTLLVWAASGLPHILWRPWKCSPVHH